MLHLDIDGMRVLIDPVFGAAAPRLFSGMMARNSLSPVSREELPIPDVILISHDHYDHLEKDTVQYFAGKNVRFLVPLGVGKHLEKWGVSTEQFQEFDWWQGTEIGSVTFTATPANHSSGRGILDQRKTLWASWVIKGKKQNIYYSGDSAYGEHFRQIGDKFGPFDLTFIEAASDGYPVAGWGHMQARENLQAHRDLQGKVLIPVHWSAYDLFIHYWNDPVIDIYQGARLQGIEVKTPMIGEPFSLPVQLASPLWWQTEKSRHTVVADAESYMLADRSYL